TTILNRSSGVQPGGKVDLFGPVLHEIGHALGFDEDMPIADYLTPVGLDQIDQADSDPNTKGKLWLYTPPGNTFSSITFTDEGGLHVYEGPADPSFPGVPVRANDLMNPGRFIANNQRELISDLDAGILGEVYGYTIKLPSTIPNFSYLVQQNLTTGVLNVNGDPENFPDDA